MLCFKVWLEGRCLPTPLVFSKNKCLSKGGSPFAEQELVTPTGYQMGCCLSLLSKRNLKQTTKQQHWALKLVRASVTWDSQNVQTQRAEEALSSTVLSHSLPRTAVHNLFSKGITYQLKISVSFSHTSHWKTVPKLRSWKHCGETDWFLKSFVVTHVHLFVY